MSTPGSPNSNSSASSDSTTQTAKPYTSAERPKADNSDSIISTGQNLNDSGSVTMNQVEYMVTTSETPTIQTAGPKSFGPSEEFVTKVSSIHHDSPIIQKDEETADRTTAKPTSPYPFPQPPDVVTPVTLTASGPYYSGLGHYVQTENLQTKVLHSLSNY